MHLLHAGPSALWALVAGAIITALLAGGSFLSSPACSRFSAAALLAYVGGAVAVRIPWRTVALDTVVPHIQPVVGLHRAAGRRARHDDLAIPVLLAGHAPRRGDARGRHRRGPAGTAARRSGPQRKTKQLMSRLDVFTRHGVLEYRDVRDHHRDCGDGGPLASSDASPRRPRLRQRFALWPASSARPSSRSGSSARACSQSRCLPARVRRDGRTDRQGSGLFEIVCANAPVFYGLCAVGNDRRHGAQPARREPDQAARPRGRHQRRRPRRRS